MSPAFRCQAIVGEDPATDEYVLCGRIAPHAHPVEDKAAHLCASHHELRQAGQDIKIDLTPIFVDQFPIDARDA